MEVTGDIETGFNAFWLENEGENWFLSLDKDQQVTVKKSESPDQTCQWVVIDTKIENGPGSYQTAYKILSMIGENEAVFLVAEPGGKKVGMGANPSAPEANWIIVASSEGQVSLQNARYQTFLSADEGYTNTVSLVDSALSWFDQRV